MIGNVLEMESFLVKMGNLYCLSIVNLVNHLELLLKKFIWLLPTCVGDIIFHISLRVKI